MRERCPQGLIEVRRVVRVTGVLLALAGRALGGPGPEATRFDAASSDGCASGAACVIGLRGTGTAMAVSTSAGRGWSVGGLPDGAPRPGGRVAVAAHASSAILVESSAATLRIRRLSMDGGTPRVRSSLRVEARIPDFTAITELAATAFGERGYVIAFTAGSSGISQLGYTMTSSDDGETWSAPTNSLLGEYGCGPLLLSGTRSGVALLHRSTFRHADLLRLRTSADGMTWRSHTLAQATGGERVGLPCMLATTGSVLVALDRGADRTPMLWRWQGANAATSALPRVFGDCIAWSMIEGGSEGSIGLIGQSDDGAVTVLASRNGGAAWSEATRLPAPADAGRLVKAMQAGRMLHLLYHQPVSATESATLVQTIPLADAGL